MALGLGLGGGGQRGARTFEELLALSTTFRSTWNTTSTSAGSSNADQITLPLVSGGTYDMLVDWGDGSVDQITAYDQAEVTHTYASGGVKTISIVGACTGFRFNNGGDKLKLTSIDNGGNLRFLDGGGYFYGCANLASISNNLSLSGVTVLSLGFPLCSSLTSFPLLDFSNIVQCADAWNGCSALTSFPLLKFSNVTNANQAWRGCTSLTSFPLLEFGNVTNAGACWYGCSSLTSFPLLDFSVVESAAFAWFDCTGLNSVGLPIGFGLNCGSVLNFTSALQGTTFATAAYDRLLVEIDSVNDNTGVTFHGGSATYSAAGGGTAARLSLVSKSWTITDGGEA
jgi:hypothetical protein